MKLAWSSAALSTVLLSGVCAHAQEAGVFDKWLNEQSPTCVPVSEFKTVSTVIELTPEQFQFVRALYVALPPVSRTLPPGDKAVMANSGDAVSATAGPVPDLKNPDFGAVAKAMGFWARTASRRQASSRSPFRPGSRNPVRRCCV